MTIHISSEVSQWSITLIMCSCFSLVMIFTSLRTASSFQNILALSITLMKYSCPSPFLVHGLTEAYFPSWIAISTSYLSLACLVLNLLWWPLDLSLCEWAGPLHGENGLLELVKYVRGIVEIVHYSMCNCDHPSCNLVHDQQGH